MNHMTLTRRGRKVVAAARITGIILTAAATTAAFIIIWSVAAMYQ